MKTKTKRKSKFYLNKEEEQIDTVACYLHNAGAQLAHNNQAADIEWFARWLYGASNFGGGDVKTMDWSLSNEEFKTLGLVPSRQWTHKNWDVLSVAEKAAWLGLSRLCLYALPHIAERIGHRFMEQSKALRILHSAEYKGLK